MLFSIILWTANGLYNKIAAQSVLLPKIKHIIKHNKARHAYWALTVRDTSGRLLQAYHSNKLMRPASNLKILAAATILHELGPDYRFMTYLYGLGRRIGKVWKGNIVLRGTGDPSMSGLFHGGDRRYVLQQFYDSLKARGIHKIKGSIIGNDSFFDHKPYPKGWDWDDLSYYYAAPINALSFNNNTVVVTIYAKGAVGGKPKVEWFPFNTNYITIVNEAQITPKRTYGIEHIHRLLGTNTIFLEGSLPQGYIERERLSIFDPPLYFLNTLKKYFKQSGIKVTGSLIVNHISQNWQSPRYKTLAVHISPPLRKLIKHMDKKSDNFYAEMLLKAAAAHHFNTRGTTKLGVSLEKMFLSKIGIDNSKIDISDGSGMSTYDFITTNDLSKILLAMFDHPAFKNSLSIAGKDGTLKYRFRNSPLDGRIKGKTGYVSGVRALSGYLQTKSNNTLIFSLLTNNYTVKTRYVDDAEASILTVLYNHY